MNQHFGLENIQIKYFNYFWWSWICWKRALLININWFFTNQNFQIKKLNKLSTPSVWLVYLHHKFSITVHALKDLQALPEMQISNCWCSCGCVTAWCWGVCCPSERNNLSLAGHRQPKDLVCVKSVEAHPHKCIARVQFAGPLPFPWYGQTEIGPGFEVAFWGVKTTNSLEFQTQSFPTQSQNSKLIPFTPEEVHFYFTEGRRIGFPVTSTLDTC